jgi:ABC-type nitrate/sulfonate/bicarbonate transport system substrate-binding protein
MDNLRYSVELNIESIGRYVETLYRLGYIEKVFDVRDVIDDRFID